jgi:hypothetical protein
MMFLNSGRFMNAVCVLLLFVSFGVIGQAFVFPHPSVDSSHIHKRGRTSFAKVEPLKVTLLDSSGGGGQGGTPPDLDREQLAVDFFSHPYFYDGDIGDAQAASATRACKFESKKVKEVLALFEKDNEYFVLPGIEAAKVLPYITVQTLEERLEEQIVCVTDKDEVKLVTQRFVPLVSSQALVRGTTSPQGILETRNQPLCFALGASGSGKTFFALKHAATFGVRETGLKCVTVYLQPAGLSSFRESKDPSDLMKAIRGAIKMEYGMEFEKLDMHLSLVLDEAGSLSLDQHFEDQQAVSAVITELRKLATSVRLVICGTGVTADNFSSEDDAFKFRMKRWEKEDLVSVVSFLFGKRRRDKSFQTTVPSEIAEGLEIVYSILNQPTLSALSTNPRMAWFLLSAIFRWDEEFLPRLPTCTWQDRMRDWSPLLVASVVASYVKNNALRSLSIEARARVAACVLYCVESCRRTGEPVAPTFVGLTDARRMKATALSLIDLNVEPRKGVKSFVNPEEKCAALVSPAITVLLFVLLGIPVDVLSNWKAQELVSALYKYRSLLFDSLERFQKGYDELLKSVQQSWAERKDCLPADVEGKLNQHETKVFNDEINAGTSALISEFDVRLGKLRLVRVPRAVPGKNSGTMFLMPKLVGDDIWLNGGKAPFADVIARYWLGRAFSCDADKDTVLIDASVELRKCGLLKGLPKNHQGVVILRVLLATWKGKPDAKKPGMGGPNKQANSMGPIDTLDNVEYLQITKKDEEWEVNDALSEPFALPSRTVFPGITVVFSTNAATIKLKCSVKTGADVAVANEEKNLAIPGSEPGERAPVKKEPTSFTINLSNDKLDNEGRPMFVTAEETLLWEKFKGTFQNKVDVRFLFT